jgi:hypothetical protein
MSLSHADALALMQIDGVTSIREKSSEPIVIGVATPDAKPAVEQALKARSIAQAVRFVVLGRGAAPTDAD